MSQPHAKPPRGLKTPNVPRPTHVAASVQQAIQRDPLQPMPGEEAAQRKHPVQRAVSLLKALADGELLTEDDEVSARAASEELQAYHAEQMAGLQQASGRAEESTRQLAEFIEDVAEMLDFDLTDRSAGEMLDVLRDRLNPPEPLTTDLANVTEAQVAAIKQAGPQGPLIIRRDEAQPHLHDVCRVLAKHFGDDPAVTFENAAGLVQQVMCDCSQFLTQFENERDRADKLLVRLKQEQDKAQQVGEQQIPVSVLRQMVSDFGGGHVENPLPALQQLLKNLEDNQRPEGWQQHTQTLIDSNLRYENVLATMRTLLSLA